MIRGISQAKAKKTSSLFPAYCGPSRGWEPGVIWGGSSGARGNPRHGGASPVPLPRQTTVAALLRAAPAAGGAGPAPFCWELPLAGLHRRLWPATLPCPSPCPAPLPAPAPGRLLSAAGPLCTSGGPGRCRPPPGPRPRELIQAAPGKPRPLLGRSGSFPALPRGVPGWARLPRRAVPGPGLRRLEGPRSLWCSVCVCVCVPTGDRDGWGGREPGSAPPGASGHTAAGWAGRSGDPCGSRPGD